MNALRVKGNWNIVKGRFKQKFAQLTGDESQFIRGKEIELIGRIQKRTGESKDNIAPVAGHCCECRH